MEKHFKINLLLKYKNNGTFIEIGSQHPIFNNNTYILESKYNWTGIMIEYNSIYLDDYKNIDQIVYILLKMQL